MGKINLFLIMFPHGYLPTYLPTYLPNPVTAKHAGVKVITNNTITITSFIK